MFFCDKLNWSIENIHVLCNQIKQNRFFNSHYDIKLKLKLEENTELEFEFVRKGKDLVLDDMEDLEDGMTIKVSIVSNWIKLISHFWKLFLLRL